MYFVTTRNRDTSEQIEDIAISQGARTYAEAVNKAWQNAMSAGIYGEPATITITSDESDSLHEEISTSFI